MARKEEGIAVEGVVKETQRGVFYVEMVNAGESPDPNNPKPIIVAYLSGKLRQNNIRIVQGDRVKVELSPYDLAKGRITYRLK
jgi:translation initiation factor IF-1